jgi:hypothetical protein
MSRSSSGSMGVSKLVSIFKSLITTHKHLFYKMQIFYISFFDLTMNPAVKNLGFRHTMLSPLFHKNH